MNIFLLSQNPNECAKSLGDRHCVKMVLETAQMLCTAHRVSSDMSQDEMDDLGIYRAGHLNHPMCVWVRSSKKNYGWTYRLWCQMLDEYQFRRNKAHASQRLQHHLVVHPLRLPQNRVPFPLCMPDECKVPGDPVASYRRYYLQKWLEGVVEYNWGRAMPAWLRRRVREYELTLIMAHASPPM